jgi:hypothetical protein
MGFPHYKGWPVLTERRLDGFGLLCRVVWGEARLEAMDEEEFKAMYSACDYLVKVLAFTAVHKTYVVPCKEPHRD